jgi:hypothetical protein
MSAEGQVSVTVCAAYVGSPARFAGAEQKQAFECFLAELPETLEAAYAQAEAWIRLRGHSRTPV